MGLKREIKEGIVIVMKATELIWKQHLRRNLFKNDYIYILLNVIFD